MIRHKPKILITNDDGIQSAGIKHLWKAIKEVADVIVVAPVMEQSAVGLSITIRRPLFIEKVDWHPDCPVYSVNGTPADCIKMALTVLLDEKPDLIISGINRGGNAGRNVLYSGTVAAVIEGAMRNIPGIAISLDEFVQPSYEHMKPYIPALIDYVRMHPLPKGSFLNVNFPSQIHHQEIKGFKLTKQGKQYWAEDPEERKHPAEGHSYFWLGSKLSKFEEAEDSDIKWLEKGYVTAVPILVGDMTEHSYVQAQRHTFETFADLNPLQL